MGRPKLNASRAIPSSVAAYGIYARCLMALIEIRLLRVHEPCPIKTTHHLASSSTYFIPTHFTSCMYRGGVSDPGVEGD